MLQCFTLIGFSSFCWILLKFFELSWHFRGHLIEKYISENSISMTYVQNVDAKGTNDIYKCITKLTWLKLALYAITYIPNSTIRNPNKNCNAPKQIRILLGVSTALGAPLTETSEPFWDSWGVLQIRWSVDVFVDRVLFCLPCFIEMPRGGKSLWSVAEGGGGTSWSMSSANCGV